MGDCLVGDETEAVTHLDRSLGPGKEGDPRKLNGAVVAPPGLPTCGPVERRDDSTIGCAEGAGFARTAYAAYVFRTSGSRLTQGAGQGPLRASTPRVTV